MKVKLLLPVLAIMAVFLVAFQAPSVDNSLASVNQKEGLYLFNHSKPVNEYEYLGSVQMKLAWSGKPEEMLKGMLKRVKKDYPKADGLIFTTVHMDRADAIKFKQ